MTQIAKDPNNYPLLRNLQFSPIRQDEEQYVVLWDPTRLSAEKLIIPLSYFFIIQHFDGEHSLEEIATLYLKRFGEFLVPDRLRKLVADLDSKLFLEGQRLENAKAAARTAFRAEPVRRAVFSGKSYPDDKSKLLKQIESCFSSKEGPEIKPSPNKDKAIRGLVAPHYEIQEAGPIYAWAYKELREALPPRRFVILGTCHAGLENFYAITGKNFQTPLGTVQFDQALVSRLYQNGQEAWFDEELCHEKEHTIEFQLPFIQHAMGLETAFTILPVLCAFRPTAVVDPAEAEARQKIDSLIRTLRDAVATLEGETCIVASAELAHIGMRYGDGEPPTDFSFHRCMQTDLEMLKYVEEGDPEAFAQFIAKEGDQRRISGFASIYTLLRLIEGTKGQVLRYDRGITDQYNSTVTYASMAFF